MWSAANLLDVSVKITTVYRKWDFQMYINVLIESLIVLMFITKTYQYNFDPLKPHVFTVKLRFTGVYIIFLISAQI